MHKRDARVNVNGLYVPNKRGVWWVVHANLHLSEDWLHMTEEVFPFIVVWLKQCLWDVSRRAFKMCNKIQAISEEKKIS